MSPSDAFFEGGKKYQTFLSVVLVALGVDLRRLWDNLYLLDVSTTRNVHNAEGTTRTYTTRKVQQATTRTYTTRKAFGAGDIYGGHI